MRKLLAALALLAASCATSELSCPRLDGTYKVTGGCSHKGSGAATFVFADGIALRNVAAMTISQPGCSLMLRVTGADGATKDVTLSRDDLAWTDDGVSISWTVHPTAPRIMPGIAAQTRTLRLNLTRDTLTVSSEFDERGITLLFIPFHDHGQASCVMTRVKS